MASLAGCRTRLLLIDEAPFLWHSAALVAWCQAADILSVTNEIVSMAVQHQGGEMKAVNCHLDARRSSSLHGSGVSPISVLCMNRATRAMDYRHDDAPGKTPFRLRHAPWPSSHVFRFQIPWLWHHPKPDHEADRLERLILVLTHRHVLGNLDRFRRGERNTAARSGTKRGFVRHCRSRVPSSTRLTY